MDQGGARHAGWAVTSPREGNHHGEPLQERVSKNTPILFIHGTVSPVYSDLLKGGLHFEFTKPILSPDDGALDPLRRAWRGGKLVASKLDETIPVGVITCKEKNVGQEIGEATPICTLHGTVGWKRRFISPRHGVFSTGIGPIPKPGVLLTALSTVELLGGGGQ